MRFQTNIHIQPKPIKHPVLVASLVTVLFTLIFEYFVQIPLNIRAPEFIICVAFIIGLYNVLFYVLSGQYHHPMYKVSGGIVGLLIAVVVLGGIYSLPIFHATQYRNLLKVDDTADFFDDNEQLTFANIPVVDRDSAMVLGDRKMGEIMDYVSQFDVADDYVQINYQDKPVRVTPLNYADLIKWFTNFRQGLPAYIKVDMVTQEVQVVRLQEKQRYSASDLFFRNIHRYLFVNYPTLMFDAVSYELDDTGIPHYVAPVYQYTIGLFGGKDIKGAVLVNAVTGQHQYYDIDEVPTWLDRVYPEQLVMNQLTDWGQYVNGFWNTIFGQRGVLEPTDGYNYVALDDDVYMYTGLTSVMSDASNVGFALIDLRTKEAKFYNISGAEENSAMQSAQGQVQDLGYRATFPILINAGGEPTYFMALKDSANLVKQYAFVSVKNYTVVATGTTVAEAQKKYFQALQSSGSNVNHSTDLVEATLVIERINSAVVESNSRYYLQFFDTDGIFLAPISISDALPLLEAGDSVKITYIANASDTIIINSIERVD